MKKIMTIKVRINKVTPNIKVSTGIDRNKNINRANTLRLFTFSSNKLLIS